MPVYSALFPIYCLKMLVSGIKCVKKKLSENCILCSYHEVYQSLSLKKHYILVVYKCDCNVEHSSA